MLQAHVPARILSLVRQLPKPGAPAEVQVGEASAALMRQSLPGLPPCTPGPQALG